MHILTVLRSYLGLTQAMLAEAAGLMQADISEIEKHPPHGRIQKFCRLSDYLGVPVDALVKNDFREIPETFFCRHKRSPVYAPVPVQPELQLGRLGEEFIFRREQERLAQQHPALSGLVLPYYKMRREGTPGYDILSYDSNGKPYYLEVKTSLENYGSFRLTNNELRAAQKLTAAGERYVICCISNWGSKDQTVWDISFAELEHTHRITPCSYICTLHPKAKEKTVTGICHFRRLRELRQAEAAERIGMAQYRWSLYETGQSTPSVETYLKMSALLDASIDELMDTYPPIREEDTP